MQRQLGHADLRTTETYYLAAMDDAQPRLVDSMEEHFFSGLIGRKLVEPDSISETLESNDGGRSAS